MTAEDLFNILAVLLRILSPAILLGIIGVLVKKRNVKASKIFFTLIKIYLILLFIVLIIGLGICGALVLMG